MEDFGMGAKSMGRPHNGRLLMMMSFAVVLLEGLGQGRIEIFIDIL